MGHSKCWRSEVFDEQVSFQLKGEIFTKILFRSTLFIREPGCMLARMFANENCSLLPSVTDSDGAYLIDRSPKYFEPILNYLRTGSLIIDPNVNPEGVLEEAKYFGI